MIWTSSLPLVLTIEARPVVVTPIKACGCEDDDMASIAVETLRGRKSQVMKSKTLGISHLPSVPFLNPIGKDTPEASSRCN